jgi:hypothetical protein
MPLRLAHAQGREYFLELSDTMLAGARRNGMFATIATGLARGDHHHRQADAP